MDQKDITIESRETAERSAIMLVRQMLTFGLMLTLVAAFPVHAWGPDGHRVTGLVRRNCARRRHVST